MKGKMIVVGVTGGIAAYKACEIVSSLRKSGNDVHVIMTKNATEFVTPLTFQSLSGNEVSVDMFASYEGRGVRHISLAKECDLAVIAPCTANIIGKIAAGIADDFLTTFIMACKAPIVLAPAMNTNMYESIAYVENSSLLKKRGYLFIEPACGNLACGDVGKGRLADPNVILEFINKLTALNKDYSGKRVLVTAGGTIAPIDPVRCIANYSSGKMGVEIARAVSIRGGEVILVLGKNTQSVDFKCSVINVNTTGEMYRAVMDNLGNTDYIIKAAAPSDYVVTNGSTGKIKDSELILSLTKGVDIAAEVGKVKKDAKLVIFAAESEDIIKNASLKLIKKNADMVIANNITTEGAGFNSDTNIASIIFKDGTRIDLDKMTKRELANIILDRLIMLQ